MTKSKSPKDSTGKVQAFKRFQVLTQSQRTCVTLCPTRKDGSCIRSDSAMFPRECKRLAMNLSPMAFWAA